MWKETSQLSHINRPLLPALHIHAQISEEGIHVDIREGFYLEKKKKLKKMYYHR